jgi:hypothetical protein
MKCHVLIRNFVRFYSKHKKQTWCFTKLFINICNMYYEIIKHTRVYFHTNLKWCGCGIKWFQHCCAEIVILMLYWHSAEIVILMLYWHSCAEIVILMLYCNWHSCAQIVILMLYRHSCTEIVLLMLYWHS